ncbi:MAG: sensor histidine kinase [Actinophytocola sp.]|uniref:sensor histidine kinase n=1 Tax=Actinophytocola sp. TaxID=1872138 RepID=UPI0013279419|nr:histidine kinase [Actinophytocola sp.]MPZ86268.1 sensor histidine kinase [Actinophytocola sp.]
MHGAMTCEKPRTGGQLAFALVAIGLCVVATGYGEFAAGRRGWTLAVECVVGVVAVALLPVLFRRPVRSALVLAALAAVAPTATPASTVGTLQVARCQPFPVAAGVAVAGIAGHTLRALWLPMPGLPFGWWVVLVVLGHAAFVGWGALGAARTALIASLEERAHRAEAEQGRRVAEARAAERAKIAREMHDVLAHRLSLLATYAGALEYRPDHPPERLSQAAGVIRTSAHQALDELREVITILRDDPAGDHPGDQPDWVGRPVPALADLPELVEESRAVGTPVEVRDELADPATLPGQTGRTAYRVVQEALTNARKHAPGQPVCVALDGAPGARLEIEVRNPLPREPVGASVIPGAGSGLVGLTERVRLAGGELDHHATPAEFRLHAWLPWPA